MVRLLVGDKPLTPFCTTGCWCGRTVGRRRVSEAVRVGRREALDTFRYVFNAAGLSVSETGVVNRAPASARRSMLVDVALTDMSGYCKSQHAMQIPVCKARGRCLWKGKRRWSPDSDAI
jgi:hypothetical protein